MSKYVIELRPDCKVVQQICESNGQVCIGARSIQYLEELTADYINEHFGSLQDDAYKRGLEDGKAGNDKGCEGCLLQGTGSNICDQCCNSYANQWKSKDDKIEVGDEVTAFNELTEEVEHFVVIEVGSYFGKGNVGLFALYGNNKSSVDFKAGCFSISAKDVTKTGRHFDIEKILEDMKA